MWTEVRHLLWLQWLLLRSTVKRGSRQDWARLLGILLLAVMTLPGIFLLAGLLMIGYRLLDLATAAELLTVALTGVFMFWLATPLANQQLTESFDLPRLLPYPVSFGGLALGSLLTSLLSFGPIAIAPFLISIVVGFPRSWITMPAVAFSTFLFFLALMLVKLLLDDVLDLIAEDRRLRAAAIFLSMMPILAIYTAQLYVQTTGFSNQPAGSPVGGPLLGPARVIASLKPSRYTFWLPSGWAARAIATAASGDWRQWVGWSSVLLGFIVLATWGHLMLLRKLYFGELVLSAPPHQQRRRATVARIPSLPWLSSPRLAQFWALLQVDLRGLVRNPVTTRMVIAPLLAVLMLFFFSRSGVPTLPMALAMGAFIAYVLAMNPGHNQLAILDHRGLGTLLLSPVDRRLILISHNMALLLVAVFAALLLGGGLVVLTGNWLALPAGVLSAFCCQLLFNGLDNLTAVYLPYRMDMEKGRAAANEGRTNFMVMVILLVALPLIATPPALMLVLSYLLWRPGLWMAIPGAIVYSVVVYVVLLYQATRAFRQREERLLLAIVDGR
ncbi:MAG TPA: hypothetical protein EYP04_03135 [Anaerolineae bacterium]|nr:hypothetical protein [Anaerolineae bacterium]HIQ05039.1 hypothetical protein [Anaerolineae bacterium]